VAPRTAIRGNRVGQRQKVKFCGKSVGQVYTLALRPVRIRRMGIILVGRSRIFPIW
jgi:hypothetical protein